MRRRMLVAIALVAACAAAHPLAQFGQQGPPPKPTGPAPRTTDGHPDLSGVWWPGRDVPVQPLRVGTSRAATEPRPGSIQSLYEPEALAKWKSLSDKDDPALRCIPVAFGTLNVSLFGLGFIGQIVQTPKFVTLLTETYQSFKLIPIDGRPHRDDVAPSYRGDSIGRWDGDTLVVDTTNFTDENWLYAEGNVSFHSDALHVVERYRRTAANLLEVDATIEDPKVLTAPYTVPTQTLQLAPFDQIMELTCANLDTAALMDAAAKQGYGRK
jgi:hypothetical protein